MPAMSEPSTPPPHEPLFLHSPSIQQTQPPSSFASQPTRGNTTWHTLLTAPSTATDSLTAGIASCPAHGSLALHRHAQAEIYYVLSGAGEVEVEGRREEVGRDSVVWIPGDAEHGVFCGEGEGLRWLYVFAEGRMEDVGYRFSGEGGA